MNLMAGTFESSSAEYSMFLIAISTPKPGSCSGPPAPWNTQPPAVDAPERHAFRSTGRYTYLTALPARHSQQCGQKFPVQHRRAGEGVWQMLSNGWSTHMQAAPCMQRSSAKPGAVAAAASLACSAVKHCVPIVPYRIAVVPDASPLPPLPLPYTWSIWYSSGAAAESAGWASSASSSAAVVAARPWMFAQQHACGSAEAEACFSIRVDKMCCRNHIKLSACVRLSCC